MRRLAWVMALILAVPTAALAHGHHHHYAGCGHYGYGTAPPGPRVAPPPAAVQPPAESAGRAASIEGTVQDVYSPRGLSGQRLELETSQGTVTIFAGPRWFLQEEGWTVKKGDRIRIRRLVGRRAECGRPRNPVRQADIAPARSGWGTPLVRP